MSQAKTYILKEKSVAIILLPAKQQWFAGGFNLQIVDTKTKN